ncbi:MULTISPECIES: hypothetical protein [Paraburkholderia]|uniref:hypothetical protein n=1 Tax=Paraburkholderia TaxID=1822464 RepID=UPI001EEFB489|nr:MULTISPECIES: hypothetical protein [Paraburkholderia]
MNSAVAWSPGRCTKHLYTELMLPALDMALQQRRHEDVILHSDQGCQPNRRARKLKEIERIKSGTIIKGFKSLQSPEFSHVRTVVSL